ncbi:hypothetical protein [Nitratireductor sp. GCM10026969]
MLVQFHGSTPIRVVGAQTIDFGQLLLEPRPELLQQFGVGIVVMTCT